MGLGCKASEVAQRKLDTQWVILSECNTATPDGTPGAEGLSGLAKALLYAGGRAMLVSPWPVVSAAAARSPRACSRRRPVLRISGAEGRCAV